MKDYLYPLRIDEKLWQEEDCDDLFVQYYTCREALRDDGSVYVSDGLCVFPDGTTYDDSE